MEQKLTKLFVVKNHELENKSEPVGLSLNGYNPTADDFFEMPLNTAERLKERLNYEYPNL